MAERGAPLGNTNYRKGRLFADALREALALPSRVDQKARIAVIADNLVSMAEEKDLQAIREIADRLDGKPTQAITGEDGGPVRFEIVAPWMAQAVAARNE
jgi:ribosomal protein L1